MALTIAQRKKRLPRGAQKRVAEKLACDKSFVSLVVAGRAGNYDQSKVQTAQRLLAEEMDADVELAFGKGASLQKVS